MEEARPHREKAAELSAQAKTLEEQFREKRKAKALSEAKLAELEAEWKATEKESRETLAKGDAIEDAAYDLKAVNPNRVASEDKRTPTQLIDAIAAKGREADAAIVKLRQLTETPSGNS